MRSIPSTLARSSLALLSIMLLILSAIPTAHAAQTANSCSVYYSSSGFPPNFVPYWGCTYQGWSTCASIYGTDWVEYPPGFTSCQPTYDPDPLIPSDCTGGAMCCQQYNLYKDADGDGYVSPTIFTKNCLEYYNPADINPATWTVNSIYTSAGTDCNDNNANVHPEIQEICGDGIDNDCLNGEQAPCLDKAYEGATSGCMSFCQNGAAIPSTGCNAFALSQNCDTACTCNTGYMASTVYGYATAVIGADITDTAYSLIGAESLQGARPHLLPALLTETSFRYPYGLDHYTACWPTAATKGYTCLKSSEVVDTYLLKMENTQASCSLGGTESTNCRNYFCGITSSYTKDTAYRCKSVAEGGNGGTLGADGYCKGTYGTRCISHSSEDQTLHDVNCRTDLGYHCVDMNGGSPPTGVQGRCCSNGQRSTGSGCEDPYPCSCSYDITIISQVKLYLDNCVSGGQACAKFNPPTYGAAVLWDTRPYIINY